MTRMKSTKPKSAAIPRKTLKKVWGGADPLRKKATRKKTTRG
jgi:hypothetical protein